jgi:hypothetical protein
LFGHARQLRATNPKLDPEHLHALMKLYWQCYGTNDITNNEIQLWFVKGYVAGKKGEKLNWCAATARILRLKVGCMLLAKVKSGEINMSEFLSFAGDGNPAVFERGDSKSHIIDRPITADGVCLFRVSTTDLEAIDNVLTTFSEVLQLCRGKVVTLEAARNSIHEKLFALELNIDIGNNDAQMGEIAHVRAAISNLADLESRRASTRTEINVAHFFLDGYKKRPLKG